MSVSAKLVYQCPISLYQLVNGISKSKGSHFFVKMYQRLDFSAFYQIFDPRTNEIALDADISMVLNFQHLLSEHLVFFDVMFNDKLYNFSMKFNSKTELEAFVDYYVLLKIEESLGHQAGRDERDELERFKEYCSLDESSAVSNKCVEHEYITQGSPKEGMNTILRTSPSTGKVYIVRRSNRNSDLGMFSYDYECKFQMAVQNMRTPKKETVSISDALLNSSQGRMYFLDESAQSSIHDFDVVRGQIIKTYEAVDKDEEELSLSTLMPEKPHIESSTFLAFNTRDTMRFDPRVGRIVDRSAYKGVNMFTSGKTTTNGKLVMGSANGILRLYSGPCKQRATVNFQANTGSDPIIGVDVSPDEQWLLAACPFYLSIVNIYDSHAKKTAFDTPMRGNRPPLRRLVIKPEHQQKIAQHFNGKMPPFSNAKFDLNGSKISGIIACIGTGMVRWEFESIQQSKQPVYTISLIGSETVIDNDPFNDSSHILFMTENQLTVLTYE